LLEQGYLVQEAAELVGVKDNSYFSKVYKKYFGHPPSEDVGIGGLIRKG
jgi:YesN/AraC family two-component response regulator